MVDKTRNEIIKCLDTAAKLLRGEAVSSTDNESHVGNIGTSTSERSFSDSTMPTSRAPPFQYSRQSSACNLRHLFKPYDKSTGRGACKSGKQPSTCTTWTHRFFCLSSKDSETVPSKEEKRTLFEAGLGERKLTLVKTSDPSNFLQQLEEKFPKLRGCGGIELLRTSSNSRSSLQMINPGQNGYTVEYLANCYLGQATCFIRPIQKDLDDTPMDAEETMQTERCMTCGRDILLTQLRSHVRECVNEDSDEELPYIDVPKITPEQQQTTKCVVNEESDRKHGECPVCSKSFPETELQLHAATCGDENKPRSFISELSECEMKLSKELWQITVIRRHFLKTALEQLNNADKDDWGKKPFVKFIGEEGVDSGGLSREYFSLLFEKCPILQDTVFDLNSDWLEKKQYALIGKAVAVAILNGHPGPACFASHIVDYILKNKEPVHLTIDKLKREDIINVIKQIQSANTDEEINDAMAECADIFQMVGFNKVLKESNKNEAVSVILKHFLFYRFLPATLQFMDGLKLHGVLGLLQKYPDEGASFLQIKDITPASDVLNFFIPVYSRLEKHKEVEEIIVYNFHQLLRKIERGNLSTSWIDIEDEQITQKTVVITMAHLLQALVGSPYLPKGLTSGIIEFDHSSNKLTRINTCAPSITFSNTEKIQDIEAFEESILNIIVCSPGFGLE